MQTNKYGRLTTRGRQDGQKWANGETPASAPTGLCGAVEGGCDGQDGGAGRVLVLGWDLRSHSGSFTGVGRRTGHS